MPCQCDNDVLLHEFGIDATRRLAVHDSSCRLAVHDSSCRLAFHCRLLPSSLPHLVTNCTIMFECLSAVLLVCDREANVRESHFEQRLLGCLMYLPK